MHPEKSFHAINAVHLFTLFIQNVLAITGLGQYFHCKQELFIVVLSTEVSALISDKIIKASFLAHIFPKNRKEYFDGCFSHFQYCPKAITCFNARCCCFIRVVTTKEEF